MDNIWKDIAYAACYGSYADGEAECAACALKDECRCRSAGITGGTTPFDIFIDRLVGVYMHEVKDNGVLVAHVFRDMSGTVVLGVILRQDGFFDVVKEGAASTHPPFKGVADALGLAESLLSK